MRLSPASLAAAASQVDKPQTELPQLHHASALRNRVPILKALLKLLPNEELIGDACEIGAGTGALLEVLAPGFPGIQWLPTEYVPSEPVEVENQWAAHGKIGRRLGSELETLDAHLQPFANVLPSVAVCLHRGSPKFCPRVWIPMTSPIQPLPFTSSTRRVKIKAST